MKISYAITVCNEIEEIKKLLPFLIENKREEDEIVVQQDNGGEIDNGVYTYLTSLEIKDNITFLIHCLDNDFAQFKNYLNSQCTGDYIFQIDADELPNIDLIKYLPGILQNNPNVDLFWVPRINTVENLTPQHVQKWGWRVDEIGWVNFPDYQGRIYRNSPEINWENKVHEKVVGVKEFAYLPELEDYCLYHPKDIKRQEKQNKFYETI